MFFCIGRMKWEYKKVFISVFEDVEGDLNQLGEEGWELVSFAEEQNRFYFKRPI